MAANGPGPDAAKIESGVLALATAGMLGYEGTLRVDSRDSLNGLDGLLSQKPALKVASSDSAIDQFRNWWSSLLIGFSFGFALLSNAVFDTGRSLSNE